SVNARCVPPRFMSTARSSPGAAGTCTLVRASHQHATDAAITATTIGARRTVHGVRTGSSPGAASSRSDAPNTSQYQVADGASASGLFVSPNAAPVTSAPASAPEVAPGSL